MRCETSLLRGCGWYTVVGNDDSSGRGWVTAGGDVESADRYGGTVLTVRANLVCFEARSF